MAIVTRSGKGAPLTAAELDGNFIDLDDRLTALEAGATTATEAVQWTGEYDPLQSYTQGQGVTYATRAYVCTAAATGIAPTTSSYWEPVGAGHAASDALIYSLIFS